MSDGPDAILAALAAFPARLAAAAGIAASAPTTPGEWPPTDVVRHLIAVELEVWRVRLAQLDIEAHPRWSFAEPDRWSGEPGASLDRLLATHRAARATTTATLAGLDGAGWRRTGTHDTFGTLDVAGLLRKAVAHDEEHLASFAP